MQGEFRRAIMMEVGEGHFRSPAVDVAYSHVFRNRKGEHCLVEVLYDPLSPSPREDGFNLWTWVTTEKAGYSDRQGDTPENYENPDTGMLDTAWANAHYAVPLYLYRHGMDVISVGKFPAGSPCDCRWDSGCMGFAFVEKAKAEKEWAEATGCAPAPEDRELFVKSWAVNRLHDEVKTMNMLNAGEVYGLRVVNMETDEEDSTWGNYISHGEFEDMVSDFLREQPWTFGTVEEARAAIGGMF